MRTEARDKVTEILGFAPSFQSETIWIWKTVIGEFRLAPIHSSDDSFIVFIHNLKAGPRMAHVCSGIHEVIEITTQYNEKVVSTQAYIDPYLQVMYAIKWRTEIIGYMDREDHPNIDISLLPLYMKVETIALQIRTVTEFIALAALAANKPLFEQEGDKFKEFWHAERIFRDIAEKNPDFYPKPIEPIHMTHIDNIDRNIRFIEDEYMTRDMCIEVHQKCCDFLHAQNPFAENQERDYEDFMIHVPDWINLIANLLNYHVFRPLDSDDIYVVHMHDEVMGDYPFMYSHSLFKLPPELQAKLRGEHP